MTFMQALKLITIPLLLLPLLSATDAHASSTHAPQMQSSETASIGDYVWNDINANGKQDETEPPFPNVTVNLWNDESGDGNPDTELATTTTDENGLYEFTDLDPALTYFVQVERQPHYYFSPMVDEIPETEDSDFDELTGFSDTITLEGGQFDATIDAGLTTPPMLTMAMTANVTEARPGDLIEFTIGYANVGYGNATNVVITYVIPHFTQFVAEANAESWTCEYNELSESTACAYTIDELPPQTFNTEGITLTVQVDEVVPEEIFAIDGMVIISDDGNHGSAPSGGPLEVVFVDLLQPTPETPATEPTVTFLPVMYVPATY